MPPADGENPGASGEIEVKPGDEGKSASEVLNNTAPWYGELPETNDDEKSFKQWVEKKDWKDPLSALKGYRELEKHVGANRVVLPKEGDDITQWEGWDKIGAPKEAKGYTIEKPALPEGMTWDEGFENTIKEVAAKVRLHPSQLKPLVDAYTQLRVREHDELQQHHQKEADGVKELYKEWGVDKDTNLDFAKRGARYLGWTDAEIDGIESVAGRRETLSALAKLGKKVREGATADSDTSNTFGAEAALAELKKLNERIEKGETLSDDDMKRRSRLYVEATPLLKQGRG